MKLGTTELVKFKRLQTRLTLRQWQAVGILESLWLFTSRNAKDGLIGIYENVDIASAMEWDGDPDELIAALVDARWLDKVEHGRLAVHDWFDHLPTWIKGSLAASESRKPKDAPKVPPKERPKDDKKDTPKDTPKEPPSDDSSNSIQFNSIQFNPPPPQNGYCSDDPWQEAEEEAAKFVSEAEKILVECRRHELVADDVHAIITYWHEHRKGSRWSSPSGALAYALAHARPMHRSDWARSFPDWKEKEPVAAVPTKPAPVDESELRDLVRRHPQIHPMPIVEFIESFKPPDDLSEKIKLAACGKNGQIKSLRSSALRLQIFQHVDATVASSVPNVG